MTEEERKPFSKRVGDGVRHAGRRSREELTRKGGIPDQAHGWFRGWMRKIWQSRGGGFYAMGWVVTFLYLELTDIFFDDIPTLATMSFISADIFNFAIDFLIDTLINTVKAFMWPVYLIQWNSPYGLVALIGGFILFPMFVQKPVEHWLFEGKEPPKKEDKEK